LSFGSVHAVFTVGLLKRCRNCDGDGSALLSIVLIVGFNSLSCSANFPMQSISYCDASSFSMCLI
jgi:hypothetical protein